MIRFGVACADERARRGLEGPELLFFTGSGREAARLCGEYEVDALLVSGALRETDGRGLVARLKAEAPTVMPAVIALGQAEVECAGRLELPARRERLLALLAEMSEGGDGIFPEARLLPDCAARISRALDGLGVPARLKGRKYMEEALELILRDGRAARNLAGRVYPRVGRENGVSASGVERAVRTAIENAWKRPRYEYFGSLVDPARGMPTVGEFLSQTAENLRRGIFR